MDLEGATPSSPIRTRLLPTYVLGVQPSVPSVCVCLCPSVASSLGPPQASLSSALSPSHTLCVGLSSSQFQSL